MQKTIPDFISSGAISVDSIEAFGAIIAAYPDRPDLLKMHADLLAQKGFKDRAVEHYEKAAGQFLSSGKLFQAWVATILQWRLRRPSREDLLKFHLRVENAGHDGSAANGFIQRILPAERMALFSRFRTLCLPPGKLVCKAGQRQTHLHLIVSGVLKEASYQTVEQKSRFQRQFQGSLGEGGIFGDIYPFTEDIPAQAYIETVTRVELLSISRRRLIQVCRKYPNVERNLIRLSRIRSSKKAQSSSDAARKGERYLLPTKLTLELLPSAPEEAPVLIDGYSQDLSVSGVSFVPDRNGHGPEAAWRGMTDELVHREVRVTIPNQDLSIAINGRIVRKRELAVNGYRIFSFGIQFAEMPPRLRGAFFAFAEIRCASDRELEALLAFDSVSS